MYIINRSTPNDADRLIPILVFDVIFLVNGINLKPLRVDVFLIDILNGMSMLTVLMLSFLDYPVFPLMAVLTLRLPTRIPPVASNIIPASRKIVCPGCPVKRLCLFITGHPTFLACCYPTVKAVMTTLMYKRNRPSAKLRVVRITNHQPTATIQYMLLILVSVINPRVIELSIEGVIENIHDKLPVINAYSVLVSNPTITYLVLNIDMVLRVSSAVKEQILTSPGVFSVSASILVAMTNAVKELIALSNLIEASNIPLGNPVDQHQICLEVDPVGTIKNFVHNLTSLVMLIKYKVEWHTNHSFNSSNLLIYTI